MFYDALARAMIRLGTKQLVDPPKETPGEYPLPLSRADWKRVLATRKFPLLARYMIRTNE
jgi:hypothetical protein